jgi:hypothetical protein
VRLGEEAEEEKTWNRVTKSLIRASDISLGASGRQEEGRREAPR